MSSCLEQESITLVSLHVYLLFNITQLFCKKMPINQHTSFMYIVMAVITHEIHETPRLENLTILMLKIFLILKGKYVG